MVSDYLREEVRLVVVAFPFDSLPLGYQVSRLGVVPKGLDKARLILDLSRQGLALTMVLAKAMLQ